MSFCFALRKPVFGPAMRLIASITNSFPALVTTTFDHGYITGTIIRLDIPVADGMQQANQFTGPITVTSPTAFTILLDTTYFDVFSIPVDPIPDVNTCAQVVPIGEVSSLLTAAVQNILP